jgi:glycosyltransferase involved in cell wall biosynthesis
MTSELQAQAQAEKLANVQFAGSLKATALLEQYRQADIFLFPSRWEGSPKVILEAAACGPTGYLGSSDDELLERLGEPIASYELRRKMGRASRLHSERFDWDAIPRPWEDMLEALAGQRENGAHN